MKGSKDLIIERLDPMNGSTETLGLDFYDVEEHDENDNFKDVNMKKTIYFARSFLQRSTAHGFRYLGSKNRVRQLVWLFMVLASTGLLVHRLHEVATRYFEYPFTTTVTSQEYDIPKIKDVYYRYNSNVKINDDNSKESEHQLKYPAITICNLNHLKDSKMNGTSIKELTLKFQTNDSYHNWRQYIKDLQELDYFNELDKAEHSIKNMLVDCKHAGPYSTCYPSDFKSHQHFESFGECFTYDWFKYHHGSPPTEPSLGLRIKLNIEHDDYLKDFWTQEDAGIRLIIHDREEIPFRHQGVRLSPGFHTYVSLKETKTFNLPPPYSTKCGDVALKYYDHYSQDHCWMENFTDVFVDKCKCKLDYMPGNDPNCTLSEFFNCSANKILWDFRRENPSPSKLGCPLECEKTTYQTSLSYAQFPSYAHSKEFAKKRKMNGTDEENREFFRNNYLEFSVFFDELKYTKVEQRPSYDMMIMLGDLGGKLSLFLGTSILTYLEFFDCIAMILFSKYTASFTQRRKNVFYARKEGA